jgi:hypothetical protein
MSAAEIAHALGDARREGRGWRCRCPLHGERSLTLRDRECGRLLITCWGGCDGLDVLSAILVCDGTRMIGYVLDVRAGLIALDADGNQLGTYESRRSPFASVSEMRLAKARTP